MEHHELTADALPWLTDEELRALAGKVAKKSKRSPSDIVVAAVGEGSYRGAAKSEITIATMVERKLLPKKALVADIRRQVRWAMSWVSPQTIIDLLRDPWPDETFAPVLDGYSSLADFFLTNVTLRAPELVAAQEASLAPEHRRALPLVRLRLGLDATPLEDALARELARCFFAQSTRSVLVRKGDEVEDLELTSYAAAKAWATTLGLGDCWDDLVFTEGQAFVLPWKVEPLYTRGPASELPALLLRAASEPGARVFDWIATRGDSAETLLEVIAAMRLDAYELDADSDRRHHHRVKEYVAVLAGSRLAAAGRLIPESLDGLLWLQDTDDPRERNDAYVEALRAFPRERVLARVRIVLALERDRMRAAVGLGAHFDDVLFEQLVETAGWSWDPGERAGRLPPRALPRLVEKLAEAVREKRTECRLRSAVRSVLAAESDRTNEPVPEEHDIQFLPAEDERTLSPWRSVFERLPRARRDAWMRAWGSRDPYQPNLLHLCSDEVVDEMIGQMFDERASSDGYWGKATLGAVGPRAAPMIRRHFLRHPDAAARALLANLPFPEEEREALLATGAASQPEAAPQVAAETGARLQELMDVLDAKKPKTALKLTTGAMAFATHGSGRPRALGKALPAGTVDVHVHYSDLEPEGATSGLDAVSFRVTKAPVVRWEEVLDTGGKPLLDSNVIGLIFGDQAAFERVGDDDREGLDEIIQDNTAYGEGVEVYKKKFLCLYVGEVATAHNLYWGLDAAGQPARLLAAFHYASD